METNPAGNESRPAVSSQKTWKDYIGWAGFVVTAGILIQQIYVHGGWLLYYFSGEGTQYIATLTDPEYSLLHHITVVFDVLRTLFFTLHPLVALALMLLRKKITVRLLVIFAWAAVFSTTTAEVLFNLMAAQSNEAVYLDIVSVVYLMIDIALVLFYSKSKRFKALFVK